MSLHPTLMSLTVALPGGLGTLDERALGHTIYMRVGDHVTSTGKHWVSLTVPNSGAALGTQSDPLGNLRLLAGASGKVTRVGKKKIDGVQTTHYRATVDPALALARVPDSLKVPGTDEAVASIGPIPVDVYIAADGTVRRVDDKVKSSGLTATIEMTLTPVKQHVSVVAPPRADVMRVQSISDVFLELGLPGPTG
jgi:hypothetical protein